MSEFFKFSSLTPDVFEVIREQGYISISLLTSRYRDELLLVAQQEPGYELSKEQYKDVKEELEFVKSRYMQSKSFKAFSDLRDLFKGLVNGSLSSFKDSPFPIQPYNPNEITIQRYRPGMLGITPHVDNAHFINLIAIFNLGGDADLFHCQDSRYGKRTKIDTTPGNAVLLKAPGFYGARVGELPYHTVSDIRSERYICTLRQDSGQLWD